MNQRGRFSRAGLEKMIILGLFILLALLMRVFLRGFESGDMRDPLLKWLAFIKSNGLLAFRSNFSIYPPLYTYLLGLASFLAPPIPRILDIKLISIAFDLLCSYYVYQFVSLRSHHGYAPILAVVAVLFAPTVVFNSSVWGQNDMVYTAWLVACVYFLATGVDWASMLCFGLALAVKLQAVFLAPLLIGLLSRRSMSWKALLLIPAPYLVSILPAWALGRPLGDLLTVYFRQATTYPMLTLDAPTLYAWIPAGYFGAFATAGLIFGLAMVCLYALAIFKSRIPLSGPVIVQLATFSVLFLPFVLPEMHERYFFPADVLSIVFAFYFPAYFFIPILVGGVSFFSYLPYLFGVTPVPLVYLALVQLGTIVLLARQLLTTLFPVEYQGPTREQRRPPPPPIMAER